MFGQGHNMVSWSDYEGVDGFGVSTQAQVDDLNKALVAGQAINAPGSVVAGDAFALRVESLEKTLKVVTFKMDHIKFWKNLPKLAAYNTVEEHNVLHGYGQNPDAGFIAEGELPESDDSSYERAYSIVKYLGTTRKVSHVMTMVKPAHGNVIAAETVNGTMHLLRILERALFEGDADLCSLQFDGYEKQIVARSPAANRIDLRGKPLSEDVLQDAALVIHDAPNYGTPTHLYTNPKVKSDLCKTFFPKERYDLFAKPDSGMIGLDMRGFVTQAGDVMFESDSFITDGGGTTDAVGDSSKRPATPTASTGPTTPSGGASSQFGSDDIGDYYVKAQACNRYGRSAALAIGGGAITVDAGEKITFGLTPGAGAGTTEWYEIFRTKKNGASGTERRVLRVKNAAGVGETVINDFNAKIPGTTSAFLFQLNLEAMSFKQLSPMVKLPLATVDTSVRWAQLLYGCPVLYAPGKIVLLQNVGRASGGSY